MKREPSSSSRLAMEGSVLSEKTFRSYSQLLYKKTGISLPPHKLYLAEARLSRFIGPRKPFSSHEALFEAVISDPDGEWMEKMINVLTTNFSFFFRDSIHFETLAWYIRERGPVSKSLRFWSAAASTGEEAYSMAITLAQHRTFLPEDTKILATDISTRVLATAREARYPAETIAKTIALQDIHHWFLQAEDGTLEVKPEIRSWITFGQLNLKDPFPIGRPMDMVFLRNVMIYFDKASKEEVVHRVAKILRPGGLLAVGLSESLVEVRHPFRMLRNSLYQKTGP